MSQNKSLRKLLTLSITFALATGPISGFADDTRVDELEARIAELEALVRQLVSTQSQPSAAEIAEVESRAEAAATARIDQLMAAHHEEEEAAAKKHSFAVGGYIKTDMIYSDYSAGSSTGAGRDFYIPGTVPVGDFEARGESYVDFQAKESRINFKTTHLLDNGSQLGAFIEMDFLLSGQGDERVSNSFSPRLRHAFLTYDKWLFGQTWMTFFNVAALPDNLDFVGPAESTIFGRQAMVRYTSGPWQFALENPETTITPYGGKTNCDEDGNNCITRIVADDNHMPDLVARYNVNRDWGGFTVAALLRELRYQNRAAGISDSTNSYGISLSGVFKVGERDDFRWMLSSGKGMGRYIGLNTANAAVLDLDGNLETIDSTGVFGSYRHFWSEQWRSNLTLGYLKVDNDTQLTGTGVTKDAGSMHVNLIYSPVPKLDIGLEWIYAQREVENGDDGDLNRLQFSAKYAY